MNRKRTYILIATLLILSLGLLFSQQERGPMLTFKKGDTYDAQWKEVEKFQNEGLPKSALEVVEEIYRKAKSADNHPQIVKALIYQMINKGAFEEEPVINKIETLEKEITESKYPVTPVLQSMLAETYWSYYQQNRWNILERSETSGADLKDIRVWSAAQFVDKTIELYRQSLTERDKLMRTRIDLYDDVINQVSGSRTYRPTLYDLLGHRAVDFFMNDETDLTRPVNEFRIRDAADFAPAKKFAAKQYKTDDQRSLKFQALTLLQDLVGSHLNDDDPAALVDVDLKRLSFMKANSSNEEKDDLYLKALKALEKAHIKSPVGTSVSYAIARYYADAAGNLESDDDPKRWYYKTAFDICAEAIERFPESPGAKNCQALQNQITRKSLDIQIENVNEPNKPILASVGYRNLEKVYFRLIAVSPEQDRSIRDKGPRNMRIEDWLQAYLAMPAAKSWTIDLPKDTDYRSHRVEIEIPALPNGRYVVLAATKADFSYTGEGVAIGNFWTSNIGFVQKPHDESSTDFYVFDQQSGEPLANVHAQFWFQEFDRSTRKQVDKKSKDFRTDENGHFRADFPPKKRHQRFRMEFTHKDDRLFMDEFRSSTRYRQPRMRGTRPQTFFFTDRSIYRPGQTLYFKGIMLQENDDKHSIMTGEKTTVTLYDVNGQKVSDQQFTSNDYGTISGTFTLPSAGLTGQMRLQNAYGSVYFSVEEYKRPKFEVSFDPVEGSYRLNDEISVSGKAVAYSGANIDNAEVQYRVVRQARFPYFWRGWKSPWVSSPEVEVLNGVAKTDASGSFKIEFTAVADPSIPAEQKPIFNYQVYADVTDINGETRSGGTRVSVGYVALDIDMTVPETVNRDEPLDIPISSRNLNGQFEAAKGTLTLFKLDEPNRIFRDRLWPAPDRFLMEQVDFYQKFDHAPYKDENNFRNWELGPKLVEHRFDTAKEKSFKPADLAKMDQGKYCLQLISSDKFGNELKVIKFFSLYSLKEKSLPANDAFWFSTVKGAGEPGEEAEFMWGSAAGNVTALLEVYHKNDVIEKRWIKAGDDKNTLTFPIKEAYRGNFGFSLFFVKNGRLHQTSQNIRVPWSNKDLKISYETFRDKLKPGQEEEWRIKISGAKKDLVAAEMLAGMYDASLDAFRGHSWSFNIFPNYSLPYQLSRISGASAFTHKSWSANGRNWNPRSHFTTQGYDRLNWSPGAMVRLRGGRGMPMRKSARGDAAVPAPMALAETADEGAAMETFAADTEVDAVQVGAIAGGAANEPPAEEAAPEANFDDVQIRSNLNETAFFFPHLQTNDKGEVILKFTMPEALTRWKLLGFAHTKDLEFGLTQNEVVTQKELMAVPNAPRFLREGDKLNFTAKISNLSEKALNGSATLQLFDAITMKPVDDLMSNKNNILKFNAPEGQSAALSWYLQIPDGGLQAVTYRVIATAGEYSDGEENVLPVLTNRMLVTESLPLPIRGKQSKTFTFEKLVNSDDSGTLRHHNLALEFTSNPAWYAVQALPYMMEYPYECSEQIFTRFYANSIATHIVNSNPKIKRVFEQWKNTDALESNLEKNQELKALLLEETPWVRDAQDESERKKRIALLFDFNKMSQELSNALRKLQQNQAANGAWPWFPGMRESRYITQHIVTGLGHLQNLGIRDISTAEGTRSMLFQAVAYLDQEMADDYRRLLDRKANMEDDHLGRLIIQYLYARSYFLDIPLNEQYKAAFDYWTGQAVKYWVDKNKYMQGMLALGLQRMNDDKDTPQAIVKSLREHALHSEEFGMYWRNERGYYWYQAPIEMQSLLIEVFDEVAKDTKAVEDMKVWLLKQKQTQDWKTTKATAEACYALLLRGTDALASDQLVEITLGSEKIDPLQRPDTKVQAGTGYFKTSWKGGDIKPEMGKVTVEKKDDGVAWGAVYWQYFEQLDKITSHETPLKLKKELFLEKPSATGPVITPVTENTRLKPGDLIKVRIELRVDRAMEYVHMKDMRASGLEPINVLSGYRYQGGLGYYESTRDASTNFFIGWLPKGTFVFEYPLRVSHEGDFSNGITTIQCMYAPEFTSHSEGIRLRIGG